MKASECVRLPSILFLSLRIARSLSTNRNRIAIVTMLRNSFHLRFVSHSHKHALGWRKREAFYGGKWAVTQFPPVPSCVHMCWVSSWRRRSCIIFSHYPLEGVVWGGGKRCVITEIIQWFTHAFDRWVIKNSPHSLVVTVRKRKRIGRPGSTTPHHALRCAMTTGNGMQLRF